MKFIPSFGKPRDVARKLLGIAIVALGIMAYQSFVSSGSVTHVPRLERGTFWTLYDESELTALTVPWPPRAGENRLTATISAANGVDEPYQGILFYRLAETEKSKSQWLPMKKLREEGADVTFEASLQLHPGSTYIQFRVPGNPRGPQELSDWKVEVR